MNNAIANVPVVSASTNWPTLAARYILDLPLLMLANQKFIRFQAPSKSKAVFICEKQFMSLFSMETIQNAQFISPDLPDDLMQVLKKFEFQRKSSSFWSLYAYASYKRNKPESRIKRVR